jgi:hypothetical protein
MKVSDQLHALTALPVGLRATCNHWIGGWVGPRASLDAVDEQKKEPIPHCESNAGHPAYRLVTTLTELMQLLDDN